MAREEVEDIPLFDSGAEREGQFSHHRRRLGYFWFHGQLDFSQS